MWYRERFDGIAATAVDSICIRVFGYRQFAGQLGAIKMCSALSSLLSGYTSGELYSSSKEARRFVGNLTYDVRSHFPDNESRSRYLHLVYVERQ
jgi:hypothetical protein